VTHALAKELFTTGKISRIKKALSPSFSMMPKDMLVSIETHGGPVC